MNQDLESLKARVSRLSVMIFDIDGTLTDGRIFWVPGSGWTQMYSVRDGMGIQRLQENKTWKLWKWPPAAKEFLTVKEFR